MVLAWFPITTWNPACYIRGLIHGIGRGVPNDVSGPLYWTERMCRKPIVNCHLEFSAFFALSKQIPVRPAVAEPKIQDMRTVK